MIIARQSKWPYLLVLLGCLALFGPGQRSIPAIDRDEARFAEASRQMVETGDYTDIHFQGETRYKKPVGIYWLQAASARLLGEDPSNPIWPYRLPSLLGAIAAVTATLTLGWRMGNFRTGMIAACLLAGSLLLNAEARLATTDAVLLALVTLAFLSLHKIGLAAAEKRTVPFSQALIFWAAIGAGILVKGPLILMIIGLSVASLSLAERNLSWLKASRPISGLILTAAIVSPWLVMIGIKSHGAFYHDSLGHDFASKLWGGEEAHGAPPGTYLAEFPLSFWPGSLLAMLAIPWAWRQRRDPGVRFLLAWLVPNWLLFELVPTKLPHYVLPLFPAIAILTAASLEGSMRRSLGARAGFGLIYGAASVLLAFALAAASPSLKSEASYSWALPVELLGFVAVIAVLACAALIFVVSHKPGLRRGYVVVASLLLVYGIGFGVIVPSLVDPFITHQIICHRHDYTAQLQQGDVALVGYHEPSTIISLGRNTRLDTVDEAAADLKNRTVMLAYIDADNEAAFALATAKEQISVTKIDTITGYNYAKGKWLTLTVYRLTP